MKSFFIAGMTRPSLGQYMGPGSGWGPGSAWNQSSQTAAPAPAAVPAPPPLTPDISTLLDDKTKADLQSIIKTTKADRARINAWWDDHPDAKTILGAKYADFSNYDNDASKYDDLINTLDWRFSQGGDTYIHGFEVDNLKKHQADTQKMIEIVEGKTNTPVPQAPASAEGGNLVLSGGVALAAFGLALL